MGKSEDNTTKPALGWLPKIFLWTVVIAFGYLYLSSIDRESGEATRSSLLESVAQLSPIPITALPGDDSGSESEPAPEQVVKVEEEVKVDGEVKIEEEVAQSAPSKPAVSKPVKDAESAVFASSLMQKESAPAPEPAAPAPVVQRVEVPRPAAVQMPPQPQLASPRAPAPAAGAAPSAAAAMAPPAAFGTPAQPEAAEPAPLARAPHSWESIAERRAQVIAQYEAMRREADEQRRQYWERMRAYGPGAAPYGYPGYMPGYAPGGYPPVR